MDDTDSLDSFGHSSFSLSMSYNYASSVENTRSSLSEYVPDSDHDSRQSVFSTRSDITDNSNHSQNSNNAPSIRSTNSNFSNNAQSMRSDYSNISNNAQSMRSDYSNISNNATIRSTNSNFSNNAQSMRSDDSHYSTISNTTPSNRSNVSNIINSVVISMRSDDSQNSNITVRDMFMSENSNSNINDEDDFLNPSQNQRRPFATYLIPDIVVLGESDRRNSIEASAVIVPIRNSYEATSGLGECSSTRDASTPPLKVQKLKSDTDVTSRREEEGDGETCSICLDAWSNTGEHRLVALKCGHLFGHNCVLRWLQSQPHKDRCCPTCKRKAAARDVRFIYARKLIATDTTEIDTLKDLLEKTKQEKNEIEGKLNRSVLMQAMCSSQIRELKNRIKDLESRTPDDRHLPQPKKVRWRFALDKTIEVSKDNGCRVLTYNCRKYELCVSQKSTNGLFPGYGIRKINCIDYKLGQFVFLHPKVIRDLKYSQANDLILSVSLDKTAKLLSGQNSVVTHTITTDTPLWSCCWDLVSGYSFIVGGVGGTTMIYDIRHPNVAVEKFTVPTNDSPVVSVASTPQGFLVCQLTSCWFYHRQNSSYTPLMLPIEGPFLSLNYEEQSKQILVSCRPTLNKCAQHVVGYLTFNDSVDCNFVHMFEGSSVQTLMSRSCQIRLGSENWVAAHNESGATVSLYNVNSFTMPQSLPTQEPVVDMCTAHINGSDYLATLTQSKARIYKAVMSSY